jgi:hypothetical protein
MDRARQGRAEREVLRALERFHRREPMAPDLRVDGLWARVTRASAGASANHRGGGASLERADFEAALEALVEQGAVLRAGRRVRLARGGAGLGPEMRHRADKLLGVLRSAGRTPPRADGVARRLGLPAGVLDGLRASGELVQVAPGIDYPRDVLDLLLADLSTLAPGEVASAGLLAASLGVARRHAEALRAYATQRDRRPVR